MKLIGIMNSINDYFFDTEEMQPTISDCIWFYGIIILILTVAISSFILSI